MKKLTAILIVFISLLGLFPKYTHATSTGSFVVTAYYSPLPNQSAYIMGSYEAEIRMNGEGIRGASGKPVFAGMLAAPQTYSFGTKIYLAGLGIGEVADRGGAIVAKGQRGFQHDRIDVWMGYGEEGLRRAMYWGNRTVKGYVTYRTSAPTIKLANHPAPIWATAGLTQLSTSNIYSIGIGSHSETSTVIKLQELLRDTGFYNGSLNGQYSSIESIIYSYQLENGLVFNRSNLGAGYWGAITRSLFLKQYQSGTLSAPKNIVEAENTEPVIFTIEDKEVAEEIIEEPIVEKIVEEVIEADIFSDSLTTIDQFKRLQQVLREMKLYDGELDGEYSSIRSVIYDYQITEKIVQNENSVGAGVYGPSTRASFKQSYEDFKNKIIQEQEEKIRLEEEKVALEAKKLELEILDKEKSIANEERKTELVTQFIELEKIADDRAKEKLDHLPLLRQGDVSGLVRELQLILKQLGYFDHNDTAIYGELTRESVFNYQLDRGLVYEINDAGAGIFGPVTKEQMYKDLKRMELERLLFENEVSQEELIEHGITM